MELSKMGTAEEIVARSGDRQIIAIGRQTNQYMPDRLIDCVLESSVRHLTIHSTDLSDSGHGVSLLVEAGRVDAMIITCVGTNSLTDAKIQPGALKAESNPMDISIERIRCSGAELGDALTKTGLDIVMEKGKQIIEANGESYLLEIALHVDIALTRCRRADPLGNLACSGSSGHTSHPVVATCDALPTMEYDHLYDPGELGPDEVKVPGSSIDMILVQGGGTMDDRNFIAKRAAAYFQSDDAVNLGIGISGLHGSYAMGDAFLQDENGFAGISLMAQGGLTGSERFVDAGGVPSAPVPGGGAFGVAMSFNVIRCGWPVATVPGGLQVSAQEGLANWAVPGRVLGMGGAMDLHNGAKQAIVAMELVAKDGFPKAVSRCTLPFTAARYMDHITTDRCVIDVMEEGLVLFEIWKDHTAGEIQAAAESTLLVSPNLKGMGED